MAKFIFPLINFQQPIVNEAISLNYASVGDINGLFYYLGTNKLISNWSNPCPTKVRIVNSISWLAEFRQLNMVNRSTDPSNTAPSSNSLPQSVTIELLNNVVFILKRYTLKAVPSQGYFSKWIFSGSKDNMNWVELDNVSTAYNWAANNDVYISPVFSSNNDYIYYKIDKVAYPNDYGFYINQIEFYGLVS